MKKPRMKFTTSKVIGVDIWDVLTPDGYILVRCDTPEGADRQAIRASTWLRRWVNINFPKQSLEAPHD